MTDKLSYRRNGAIGEILLNQPDRRNAISEEMWRHLGQIVDDAIADKTTKIIVIVGMGDHFAAGADITEFEAVYKTKEDARAYTDTMLKSLDTLERATKPTIAKIRGACVGGGCSIALACDLRYADETAKLGITPGKLGLVYSIDDTRRLVRTIGRARCIEMLATGRIIDAETARSINLIDQITTTDELDTFIQNFANELQHISGWSIAATKEMIGLLDSGASNDHQRAKELMDEAFTGPHFKEGYEAFLAKRRPKFPTEI